MTDSRLTFHLSEERLKELNWAATIAMQQFARGAQADLEDTRELMAHFVSNASGEFAGVDEGRRLLGRLTPDQMADAIAKFSAAIVDWAVPKGNGTRSTSPPTDMGGALDGSAT